LHGPLEHGVLLTAPGLIGFVFSLALLSLGSGCGPASGSAGGTIESSGGLSASPTAGTPVPPLDLPFGAEELEGFERVSVGEISTKSVDFLGAPVTGIANATLTPRAEFVSAVYTMVIVQYMSPASVYGVFWETEAPLPNPDFSQKDIGVMASECGGCSDNRSVYLLPNVEGALMAGPNGPTSVSWIENGIYMRIIGPHETLTPDKAVALASQAAAAASVNT
jgi:hypothetical protein